MTSKKNIKITQVRSAIGRLKSHKGTLHTLGLRRIGHSVICAKNECTLGMVKSISYMLKVEDEGEC